MTYFKPAGQKQCYISVEGGESVCEKGREQCESTLFWSFCVGLKPRGQLVKLNSQMNAMNNYQSYLQQTAKAIDITVLLERLLIKLYSNWEGKKQSHWQQREHRGETQRTFCSNDPWPQTVRWRDFSRVSFLLSLILAWQASSSNRAGLVRAGKLLSSSGHAGWHILGTGVQENNFLISGYLHSTDKHSADKCWMAEVKDLK